MRSGGLRGAGGCGGGRQGGAVGQSAGRTAGQAAGYTAQRASGRASGRAMMWDDSHTDHVRVSVRDTRSRPLWIENRVIHISGISRWISIRLIHLVGINECITWGYPLACVNVNLPLGKQRATGTFVVEKLRTFPRSDEVPARAESELPTVPPTCRGYPHGTSSIRPQGPAARGAKMDTFEARNDHSGIRHAHRVSKWTNSPRKASISAPHTPRSHARSRPLRVALSCSKAGRFRADFRPDLLQPPRQQPDLPSSCWKTGQIRTSHHTNWADSNARHTNWAEQVS